MQIEIQIDEKCEKPKVIIITDKMTEEVSEIVKNLSAEREQTIAGFKDDIVEVLEPDNLFRIYASNSKVFAQTDHGEYQLRLRLYELEQRLDSHSGADCPNAEGQQITCKGRRRRLDDDLHHCVPGAGHCQSHRAAQHTGGIHLHRPGV